MSVAEIECFAGISGDMLLGALIDAGVPAGLLQDAAASLGIGAHLQVRSVDRSGIRATKVDVLVEGHPAETAAAGHVHGEEHEHTHSHEHEQSHGHESEHKHEHVHGRKWPEIRALIASAAIPEGAKAIAQRAFALLAEAEAKMHGIPAEKVHFHEVGAVDTITDIVCAAVGADSLGVTEWRCSAGE